MPNDIRELFKEEALMGNLLFDEPMRRHTTLRIGGSADLFVIPKEETALSEILMRLVNEGIPVMAVGGGSNLLVTDGGIEGVVLSTASLNRVDLIGEDHYEVRLFAGAGTPLQRIVNLAAKKGYKGIEGLAGIPGTVGGAIAGNAGSFGYEIGTVVESIHIVNREGEKKTIIGKDLHFGYRSSSLPEGSIVLGAFMRMEKGGVHDAEEKVKRFLREKREKQPIAERSAGCVFKNPEGAQAGRLIDEAGCKGIVRGDIEVSHLHANFFVNRGNGTASDFLALMEDVRERVMKSFGVGLDPEIKILGRR